MDDLLYNELVATPGYELDFAFGTTYSLDAESYLAIAMSFARLGEAQDADFDQPLRLLESIRNANNKVALICNRGGLTPPLRRNPLYAMMDHSVFEASDDRKGMELANFHPKVWIIAERSLDNHERRQIKVVVLSRNLTKDTSLDVAVAMTAKVMKSEINRKHEILSNWMLDLSDKFVGNRHKRAKIKKLASDLLHAGPFELDSKYEDYDFFPQMFGETLALDKLLPAQRMAVVSPFIDVETLRWMNGYVPKEQKLLITRLESLTPEIMELYNAPGREVWVPMQMMARNEIQPMNLHAKMYFSWGPREGGIYMWVGSANATHSGFHRNAEFLLRLKLKSGQNLFSKFKDIFCNELCTRVETLPDGREKPTGYTRLEREVRKVLIRKNNLSATVKEAADGYLLTVSARRFPDMDINIKIAPIQEPGREMELNRETPEASCEIKNAAYLSEFYILTVTAADEPPLRITIKIPTTGIPADRDRLIFQSIIDTEDKFLNYVNMMITDIPLELSEAILHDAGEGGEAQSRKVPALYEQLLRLAASNPQRLKDIDEVARQLNSDVVPESFAEMSAVFNKFVK